MPEVNEYFYQDMATFSDVSGITKGPHFHRLPAEWVLFMTDVVGSTKAIADGRYKEVNVVGAACLVAATNVVSDIEFPFVFGGDGVSFLVPESRASKVREAMQYAQQIAETQYSLGLRVAEIPMSVIYQHNKNLFVAKKALSPKNSIAMFSGGGLAFAESLMKKSEIFFIKSNAEAKGSFDGLQCRWNPLQTTKGLILTIIVQVRELIEEPEKIYSEILQQIEKICPEASPVSLGSLDRSWPPKHAYNEAKLKNLRGLGYYLEIAKLFVQTLIASWLISLTKNSKDSLASKYLASLVTNSDYLKFDDSLKMVLDVSQDQASAIKAILKNYYDQGFIFFGTQSANEALMTCFFQNWEEHLHFIDGANGGYSMAAKEMKQQRMTEATSA